MALKFRRYPSPYKAMLAVCSDLDETPTAEDYFAISAYLNGRGDTPIGRGLGLEVGNTLFFDMGAGEFSYGRANAAERDRVHRLIRSGHIDCFHSFGDLADSRAHAEQALTTLAEHGCTLPVWVDHAVAPTNLGSDIMQGHGDEPGHPAYHADLTLAHGVRYVWLGRVTSCIGQDVAYSPIEPLRAELSTAAAMASLKDAAKWARAYAGDAKYALHRGNVLMRPRTLRDGQQTIEFMRCNPHPRGLSFGDDAQGFGEAVTARTLKALVRRQGSSIIYTHLGKHVQGPRRFPAHTRKAFEQLAAAEAAGDILVSTTARLLDYARARQEVAAAVSGSEVELTLPASLSAEGLTFEWRGTPPSVSVNGEAVETHATQSQGVQVVSIPWRKLPYPDDL